MKKNTKYICAFMLLIGAVLNATMTFLAAQMSKLMDLTGGNLNVPISSNMWDYASWPLVTMSAVLLAWGVLMLVAAKNTKDE